MNVIFPSHATTLLCLASFIVTALPMATVTGFSLVVPIPNARSYHTHEHHPTTLRASVVVVVVGDTDSIASTMLKSCDGDSLTMGDLQSHFENILDDCDEELLTSTKDSTTVEETCLSMLCTRLPELELNRCHFADSTIQEAGRGLFASRDLLDGEIITFYPGDALILREKQDGEDSGFDDKVMFGSHVDNTDSTATRAVLEDDECRSYELKVGKHYSIVADPSLDHDSAYLGHMSNDGATLSSRDDASRKVYQERTSERRNAVFFGLCGSHYGVKAAGDIEKGSEIFVSYGGGYWLNTLSA